MANIYNRLLVIVVASTLAAVVLSAFVFSRLENEVAALQTTLKAVADEHATKDDLKARLTQTDLEALAVAGKLKGLATKDALDQRPSREDLDRRLKADLEPLATKKALDEVSSKSAADAKAARDELDKRVTKDDLDKRLKTDLEPLATKKAVDDVAKQQAADAQAAKKEAEGLATRQALKDVADGTVVRKVRLERKDLQDALKARAALDEPDRKDHELLFSLAPVGGRGEVLVNVASNVSEIDHLTADSVQADGKPVGLRLVFKNAVQEIPEKWFVELAVYRAGATDYKVAPGLPAK